MAAKTVKLEIPFQKLLTLIEQLNPDEKLILKRKLQHDKILTWQEMFGWSLNETDKRNSAFPEEEVLTDVSAAVAEVRAAANN
ncbi:MAG: hypothetical protein H7843_02590 [Nitrospirota bacterium]|uniref:Uncharacterized protein n=1 Tax=Candidatus Magnetominusculus xianensis TaxID=1748249 RepID=A0ABR5SFF2_9BACT|nr:hypothetical protein [Candidatus Magnetominusculus xianensis]KWT86051.1 hypothetical protein ASN18_1538 [Candidatus Magnetominusculus xianensis]MBF0404380.1 hypothetical protein [Nitrospirota bacterium]